MLTREPDPEVAAIIEIGQLCHALRVLPEAGGLFDQDSYIVYGLHCYLAAERERTNRDVERQQNGLERT